MLILNAEQPLSIFSSSISESKIHFLEKEKNEEEEEEENEAGARDRSDGEGRSRIKNQEWMMHVWNSSECITFTGSRGQGSKSSTLSTDESSHGNGAVPERTTATGLSIEAPGGQLQFRGTKVHRLRSTIVCSKVGSQPLLDFDRWRARSWRPCAPDRRAKRGKRRREEDRSARMIKTVTFHFSRFNENCWEWILEADSNSFSRLLLFLLTRVV